MGPVGSVSGCLSLDALPLMVDKVKIMWPRSDAALGPGADMTAARRNRNSGLSGFVSFMKRKDAEAALKEFDGFDWGGSVLRVGWSKAVPIAAKPMYGQYYLSIYLGAKVDFQNKSRRSEISFSQPSTRKASFSLPLVRP